MEWFLLYIITAGLTVHVSTAQARLHQLVESSVGRMESSLANSAIFYGIGEITIAETYWEDFKTFQELVDEERYNGFNRLAKRNPLLRRLYERVSLIRKEISEA